MSKKTVAIVGASGYTGAELIRLLRIHPHVDLVALYAQRAAGKPISDVFPQFAGALDMMVEAFEADDAASRAEIVFCALPHGQSAQVVSELHERGQTVIDLSADYRLKQATVYTEWYAVEHPHSQLLSQAVYGLPEHYRASLKKARLVAVPGCYPTSAILAISPLLQQGLVSASGLIVDAKSGVTGAGRSPSQATHFAEVGESLRAYKVGGTHRHTPEIEQELAAQGSGKVRLTFTPHLVPMSRGILSCVYAQPTDPSRHADAYHAALLSAYADEPFVQVLPIGQTPDTSHVRGSNQAHIGVAYDARADRVLAMCAIDNLVKGASGQAIQCLNITQGWDERSGLQGTGLFP